MINIQTNPLTVLSGESFLALFFAILLFIIAPLLLAVLEYRITKKDKKHGIYFIIGVFISGVLFGVFSIFVGILLTIIYLIASKKK